MKKIFQQFVLAATLLLVSSQMQAQYFIGKDTLGGKVAYIDASGLHGLIAAPDNQSLGIAWDNNTNALINSPGTDIGDGNSNTEKIVNNQGAGNYAARLCYDLVLNGYIDWYLPSKDELNQLYINRLAIGNFANNYYWSSSEGDKYNSCIRCNAWNQPFTNGVQSTYRKYSGYSVRAVRSF